MRYQVRFQQLDGTHYGIVRSYGPEVEAAKVLGLVIVEDAVLPKSYKVRDCALTDIEVKLPGRFDHATGEWTDLGEYDAYVQAAHKAARAASDAITTGVGVGSMFAIGVGDGSAHYVVVKVNKRTCRVEWRGFCGDRYTDHHFGWGGTFPLSDVVRYVEGERAMTKLFARKGEAS